MTITVKTANEKVKAIMAKNIVDILTPYLATLDDSHLVDQPARIADLILTFNGAASTPMLQDIVIKAPSGDVDGIMECSVLSYPRYLKLAVFHFNLNDNSVEVEVESVYDPVYIMLGLIETIDIINTRDTLKRAA